MSRPHARGGARIADRPRRGVALLAALWLIVMISSVGMQFATTARERRALALGATDRARAQAALLGAVAQLQARLESVPRARAGTGAPNDVLALDPWRSIDRRFAEGLIVGDMPVRVSATDLGTVVNVNLAGERELTVLFTSVLRDQNVSSTLAQRVLDWRDPDDISRGDGAETSAYRRQQRLVLPANGAFRSIDDLSEVMGMTPDILARLRPYLTTDGNSRRVNLNGAPEPVLRTIPGMTTPLLATILALRSGGRRVESLPALANAVRGAARSEASLAETMALARNLADNAVLDTREVAFDLEVEAPAVIHTARLTVVLTRNNDTSVDLRGLRW